MIRIFIARSLDDIQLNPFLSFEDKDPIYPPPPLPLHFKPSAMDVSVVRLLVSTRLGIVLLLAFVSFPTSTCQKEKIHFGVLLPRSSFLLREYNKHLHVAMENFRKSNLNITKYYDIQAPNVHYLPTNSGPRSILDALCKTFLKKNVLAILYLSSTDLFIPTATFGAYFLQLAGYLGIPVICWNADQSGLEQMSKNINLQLAPSVRHQSAAMLSIIQRYEWHQFAIITSQIAGHNDFIQAVRDQTEEMEGELSILDTVIVDIEKEEGIKAQLVDLSQTEVRIVLLYSTREEARYIISAARELGLTGVNYVWIVSHSVIDNAFEAPSQFSSGMLGVHFDSDRKKLLSEIDKAIKVFAHGLELFLADPPDTNVTVFPNLSCDGQQVRWSLGEAFYRHLKNVSVNIGGHKPLEFNYDGTLKYVDLDIMNLNQHLKWVEIGKWTNDGLDIKDIVWPGNAHMPPLGKPERFHLKVVFLEEPAFVNLAPVDPVTKKCTNQGVPCRVGKAVDYLELNQSNPNGNTPRNSTVVQCCSGFSIDLLEKYSRDLSFTYDMFRVEDGYWGTEVNGRWNGLVASILNRKADMVMTAFKINSYRETVIDFSEPFMETGIAILVAKRTGIISPKAFLEPFDTISWLFILLIGTQVTAFFIFLFEWLSPYGYGMKTQLPRDHRFSLFRTYWLVWAILFGAAVNVDCPRGYTARYLSNVWAMVAVVFLAIYTANLAAFMITREEYYNLSGVEDPKLANPFSVKPPFRYGTIPYGNTEAVMQKNLQHIYRYMKQNTKPTVLDGLQAVKKGQLDAFIYDATVLQYLVAQDDDCRLLTVGSWYAKTGYAIGFPKNFKYTADFNKYMMTYRENGDLERLRRFWLTGSCKPGKKERTSSNPLSINQFMSAFLLLSSGILLAGFLLLLEHVYFKYIRKPLSKASSSGCCALISLSMGKSLTFSEAVYEAQQVMREHRCKDALCDLHLWKVKHQLDLARMRINLLEAQLDSKESELSRRSWKTETGSALMEAALKPRDMTKNHVTTTEPPTLSRMHGAFAKSHGTEVAELETVL